MRIVCIFAEKLYAVQYDEKSINEFRRLLNQWNDIEYLFEFTQENNIKESSDFIDEIIEDAYELEVFLNQLNNNNKSLNQYFENLRPSEPIILSLQKGKKYKIGKSRLRLYAIKIEDDVFLITGGAIKMTQTMQEHPDTSNELKKLNKVRDFLIEKNITFEDAFYDFIINE
jgi:hypothetical protein